MRVVWAELNREWLVYDESGERIGSFETLLAAEAAAIAEDELREMEQAP